MPVEIWIHYLAIITAAVLAGAFLMLALVLWALARLGLTIHVHERP